MRPCVADVVVCRNADAAGDEAAARFASACAASAAESGAFHVAVPGGSTPRGVFERLSSGRAGRPIPWDRVHLFFTDERCVPPDHEDSNYGLVREVLTSRVSIPEANVHRFAGELPPIEAAAQYEQALRHTMGDSPRFDLVILGMGEDTHTASLFPDSPALDETDKLAVANFVKKLDAHRLTLTVPVLRWAREVIVLVTGKAKAEAVRIALQGRLDERAHPIQSIRPIQGRLLWIVDQAAASEL